MLRRIKRRSFLLGRRFSSDVDGLSAVEFSLIAPVIILLLLGGFEIGRAFTTMNRAMYVAEGIGQMVSQSKAPITREAMAGFIKSAAVFDPGIATFAKATGKTNLESAVNVVVSSIVFTPTVAGCVTSCTYDAHVVFSESLANWPKRQCGTLTPGGSGLSGLPNDVFSQSALIVVDVETFLQPAAGFVLPNAIGFKRSAYFKARNIDHVNYAGNCPGFPVT